MSDEQNSELVAALKEMIQTRGWQLFTEHLKDEWGPAGYGREMQRALASIPAGPERSYEIARIAEQVDATARAVNQMIVWPKEELKRLQPPPASRNPLRRIGR